MSFPAYPEYKGSGVPWVGEMPVHWGVKQLKWLFDLQKRPVRDEDEIVTAFRDGIVTLRKHRREEGFTNSLKEIGYQGIRKGDLVIHAMDGFAGAIGVSDADGKSTPVYSVCKSNEGSLADYYGRLLRYMALSGFVVSLAKGVRERSTEFRWRDASVLPLPVPPLREQRAIVQFLDRETAKIDALVAEQERLIALLNEKRQAVISHAVTKGLDPDAPMKDSGIECFGEIPAHWDTINLKQVGTISYGIGEPPPYREDGVPLIRATNVDGGKVLDKGMVFVDPADIPAKRIFWLVEGDIIVVRSGAHTGDSAIMSEDHLPAIAGFDMVFRANEKCSPAFVQLCLLSAQLEFGQIALERMRAAQPHLNAEELGGCVIPRPPLSEQQQIVALMAEKLDRLDDLVGTAESVIALLQERRAALISAAVTGKIDVRGLVEQEEMEAV